MAQMKKDQIEEFFRRLSEADPSPQTELEYSNTYTLLVAVVLSAQATDVGVNRATKDLFRIVDTPQKMIALGEDELIKHVRTIGLFRTKAKNVIALSEMLANEHGGDVPRDRAALEALPGVGRKTANVVLNTAFGEPTMAVDTHIFRLSNRTGLAPAKTVRAVETG
jgi:endonuclease-3